MPKTKPQIKKSCRCINPDTSKPYRQGECPRLKQKRHGAYWFRLEAPSIDGTNRRRPRYGPYATKQEAEEARDAEMARLDPEVGLINPRLTYREYLVEWLEGKKGLKSWSDYRRIVHLYGIPGLGHIKLKDLTPIHFVELAKEIRRINRGLVEREQSEMFKRLMAARADRDPESGEKYSTRPIGLSRLKKIIAVLRSSMTFLVQAGVLEKNPATNLPIPQPKKQKPLLWTEGRIAHWRATGVKPAKIMVWTPEQTGAFLDATRQHRLHPLYHLVLLTGLRRSEVIGLRWREVDLHQGLMTIREVVTADSLAREEDWFDDEDDEDLWEEPELDRLGTKSVAGERQVTLSQFTIDVLRAWKRTQSLERLAAGAKWIDEDFVFTTPDGRGLHPGTLTTVTTQLITRLDMAPISFHGMRHSAATAAMRAGVPMKVISENLGHARVSTTMDLYTRVVPEAQKLAAEATEAVIPRKGRQIRDAQ